MAGAGEPVRAGLPPDEADDLRRRLRQHDQMYATMQQQGKPFDALEHLEKGLFVRKELYGPEHPEVGKVCQVFTTSCNTLAMNSLQRDNHLLAYELLKKAEILTSPSGYIMDKKMRMKLRAVTFNNFGCFYKRRGKLHAALQYLAKALKIELTSEEVDNPAGTHLNLCATLSQLGRHGPALEHAQCALELLEAMQDTREKKGEEGGGGGRGAMDDGSIMAIAWHNMAVEQEHLQMIEASLHSYEQAVIVAEREWGAGHIKTLAIKHSLEEARGKAAQRRQAGKSGGTNGGHGGGAAASPLDSVLNPASSTSFVNNFRQSGIKSTAGTGANKGGGGALSRSTKLKTATAARAYGPGGQQTRNRSSVSDSWGDYLNSTQMGEEGDQGGQGQGALPPIRRDGARMPAQPGATAASPQNLSRELRTGPRTPPLQDERPPRPTRR